MASCFPLRTVLFSRFILLVFLSHHLSNVSVLPAISQEKRGELGKRKVWSHLTCSTTGPDSPVLVPATLFSPRNIPVWNEQWADEARCGAWVGRTLPTAVLQPWQGTVHPCCLPG